MATSTKIVLAVVGFMCVVMTPKANAGSIAVTERCMSDNGATRSMLREFLQGQNDSREVKCFWRCLMVESGSMNEDGSYNMEAMKRFQPAPLYAVASTTCADFPSTDPCDRAYDHIACLRDHAKDELIKIVH